MTFSTSGAALGGVATLAGIGILVAAQGITSGFGYDAVGPATFPRIIGGGLVLAGLMTVAEARKGNAGFESDERPSLGPVALILAAILLLAFFVNSVGWVLMSAIVFLAGTLAFGDRRLLLNAVIGVGFGLIIFAAFEWGLGLELPMGVLQPLLGPLT